VLGLEERSLEEGEKEKSARLKGGKQKSYFSEGFHLQGLENRFLEKGGEGGPDSSLTHITLYRPIVRRRQAKKT